MFIAADHQSVRPVLHEVASQSAGLFRIQRSVRGKGGDHGGQNASERQVWRTHTREDSPRRRLTWTTQGEVCRCWNDTCRGFFRRFSKTRGRQVDSVPPAGHSDRSQTPRPAAQAPPGPRLGIQRKVMQQALSRAGQSLFDPGMVVAGEGSQIGARFSRHFSSSRVVGSWEEH